MRLVGGDGIAGEVGVVEQCLSCLHNNINFLGQYPNSLTVQVKTNALRYPDGTCCSPPPLLLTTGGKLSLNLSMAPGVGANHARCRLPFQTLPGSVCPWSPASE